MTPTLFFTKIGAFISHMDLTLIDNLIAKYLAESMSCFAPLYYCSKRFNLATQPLQLRSFAISLFGILSRTSLIANTKYIISLYSSRMSLRLCLGSFPWAMSFLILANLPLCVYFGLIFVWLNTEWQMFSGSFLHPNLVRVERLSSPRRARRYLTLSLGLPVSFSIVFLQCHLGCLVNFLSFIGMLNAIWVHLAKFSFESRRARWFLLI